MGLLRWLFGWMLGSKGSKSDELQSVMKERSPLSIRYEKAVKNNDLKSAERCKKRLAKYDHRIERLKKDTEKERKEKLREAEDRKEKREIKKEYKEVLKAA